MTVQTLESLGSIRRSAKKRKMAKNQSRDSVKANSLDFNIAAIGKSLSNELKFEQSDGLKAPQNQRKDPIRIVHSDQPKLRQSKPAIKSPHSQSYQPRSNTQSGAVTSNHARTSIQRNSGGNSYAERYALSQTGNKNGNSTRPASLPDFQPDYYKAGFGIETKSSQSSPSKSAASSSPRHRWVSLT